MKSVLFILFLIYSTFSYGIFQSSKFNKLLQIKNYKAALNYINNLPDDEKNSDLMLFNKAQLYFSLKKYKPAILHYNHLISKKSPLMDAAILYKLKAYIETNNFSRASYFILNFKPSSKNKNIFLSWEEEKDSLILKLIEKANNFRLQGKTFSAIKYLSYAANLKKDKKIEDIVNLILNNNENLLPSINTLRSSYLNSKRKNEKKFLKSIYKSAVRKFNAKFNSNFGFKLNYSMDNYKKFPANTVTENDGFGSSFYWKKLLYLDLKNSLQTQIDLDYQQNSDNDSKSVSTEIAYSRKVSNKEIQILLDYSYSIDTGRNISLVSYFPVFISNINKMNIYLGFENYNSIDSTASYLNGNTSSLGVNYETLLQSSILNSSFGVSRSVRDSFSFNSTEIPNSDLSFSLGIGIQKRIFKYLLLNPYINYEINKFEAVSTVDREDRELELGINLYIDISDNLNIYFVYSNLKVDSSLEESLSFNTNMNNEVIEMGLWYHF